MNELRLKNRVKEFRTKLGLSQMELALLSQTSIRSIFAMENQGFVPSCLLGKLLCSALNCNFDELFYLEEVKKNGK